MFIYVYICFIYEKFFTALLFVLQTYINKYIKTFIHINIQSHLYILKKKKTYIDIYIYVKFKIDVLNFYPLLYIDIVILCIKY